MKRTAGWRRGAGVWCALCAAAMAPGARAQSVVHMTEGRPPIRALSIEWRDATREYRVETPDHTVIPIPASQVERLEIPKPPEFAQAERLLAQKQVDQAIPILDGIVVKHKMLVWDVEARHLLGGIHMGRGDARKAVLVLDPVFEGQDRRAMPMDHVRLYWNALRGAEKTSTLAKELDEAVAVGSRELAAAAQIMRGDLNRAAGRREDALLDYLRTVLLFEQIRGVQPEALFKAAELLDELRDPRADALRKKLIHEHGGSEYAARLRGTM